MKYLFPLIFFFLITILLFFGLSNNPGYIEFESKCKVLDKNSLTDKKIPADCAIWFDGCNSCSYHNRTLTGCSEKVCYEKEHEAKCESYSTDTSKKNSFLNCYDIFLRNSICSTYIFLHFIKIVFK